MASRPTICVDRFRATTPLEAELAHGKQLVGGFKALGEQGERGQRDKPGQCRIGIDGIRWGEAGRQ